MTKITLNNLSNLTSETSAIGTINANNDTIETAFDNTLSRDGTSPNEMLAVLDMNSNRIINLPEPSMDNDPVRKIDLDNAIDDIVSGGITDAFLRKTNNLSDLTDPTSARNNLGLGSLAVKSSVNNADLNPDVYSSAHTWTGTQTLVSPALTGQPTAPTAPLGTDSAQIANTSFVKNAIDSESLDTLKRSSNLSDLSNVSEARTNLGLGTLALQNGTFSGTSSGTNTGDQTITLTGDVTGSGTGTFGTTIGNGRVTNAMINSDLFSNAHTWSGLQTFNENIALNLSTASLSGTLNSARLPSFTGGDVTSSAGSAVLSIGNTRVTNDMLNADVFSTSHTWGGTQTFGTADAAGYQIGGVAFADRGGGWTTLRDPAGTNRLFLGDATVEADGANFHDNNLHAFRSRNGSETFARLNTTGLMLSSSGGYLNFGAVSGSSGYGFWDDAGTIKYKHSGGAWTALGSGAGTVTSVGMTVPTGLSVSGSPITGAGTLAVTYASGYQGFTTAQAGLIASAVQPGSLGDLATIDFPSSPSGNVLNDLGQWVPQGGGGGGGGQVNSVQAGTGISVNAADPVNPVVSVASSLFANPSATIGLTAVNGSATTAMRSDGAPALSQAIAPTWTGNHTFNSAAQFNGAFSIGSGSGADRKATIGGNFGASTTVYGLRNTPTIVAANTGSANYNSAVINTEAASFTTGIARGYLASMGTIGAGSAITTAVGYEVDSSWTAATNNRAFQGAIPAGAGNFNLYMAGTAANYLAGNTGVGRAPENQIKLGVGGNVSGNANATGIWQDSVAQSDVTTSFRGYSSFLGVAAGAALGELSHFIIPGRPLGAGATVTNQHGFYVGSGMTQGTNNYAFRGALAAAAGRYNLYMDGTAANYLAGHLEIASTTASQATNAGALVVAGSAGVGGSMNVQSNISVGGTGSVNVMMWLLGSLGSGATTYGVLNSQTIPATSTTAYWVNRSEPVTAAANFTVTNLAHYQAANVNLGAGSSITNHYGFLASTGIGGKATNTYGFHSNLSDASGQWNFYSAGSAPNYFAGETTIAGNANIGTGSTSKVLLTGTSALNKLGSPYIRWVDTGDAPLYLGSGAAFYSAYGGASATTSLWFGLTFDSGSDARWEFQNGGASALYGGLMNYDYATGSFNWYGTSNTGVNGEAATVGNIANLTRQGNFTSRQFATTPDQSAYGLVAGRYDSTYGGSAITTSGGSTFLGLQVEGNTVMNLYPSSGLQVAGSNKYINFGSTTGSSGYGLRDNSGSMEYKNSGGSWSKIRPGLEGVVSIADYGGSLNAAINALGSAGGAIYIPPGVWNQTDKAFYNGFVDNISIFGAGRGVSTLNWTGADGGIKILFDIPYHIGMNKQTGTIQDLTIMTSYAATNANHTGAGIALDLSWDIGTGDTTSGFSIMNVDIIPYTHDHTGNAGGVPVGEVGPTTGTSNFWGCGIKLTNARNIHINNINITNSFFALKGVGVFCTGACAHVYIDNAVVHNMNYAFHLEANTEGVYFKHPITVANNWGLVINGGLNGTPGYMITAVDWVGGHWSNFEGGVYLDHAAHVNITGVTGQKRDESTFNYVDVRLSNDCNFIFIRDSVFQLNISGIGTADGIVVGPGGNTTNVYIHDNSFHARGRGIWVSVSGWDRFNIHDNHIAGSVSNILDVTSGGTIWQHDNS